MSTKIESNSVEETLRFGARLAHFVRPGTVIGLQGGLGSGKTTLIQGISSGLGAAREEVKSPTFVIFHVYKTRIPVYHFDLYRLEKDAELEAIGFDEFVSDPKSISLIEWIEKAGSFKPKDFILIDLKPKGKESREFVLSASGPKSQKIIDSFVKQ